MAIPINEDPYHHANGVLPLIWTSFESENFGPTYRPDSLEEMCALTKYSKREIQILYRSFKQGCPNGIVTLIKFQEIFAQFFPNGNSKRYADLVFRTLDRDSDQQIMITRGTLREKFNWIFSLYDIDKQDCIGQSQLLSVIQSMHDLVGRGTTTPRLYRHLILDHTLQAYKRICQNKTQISREEFIDSCLANKQICESIELFDTIL